SGTLPYLHSFPTRRSSDLVYFLLFTIALLGLLTMAVDVGRFYAIQAELQTAADAAALAAGTKLVGTMRSTGQASAQWNASNAAADRKSTRLNSSHVAISYA